ncbi:monovalent cation/H(+) antiporter subunit G [Megalodesulfovibrio gigas]|uniref:Putative Na+/H+ antiporter subunit n=1 Tax=Megalodesulfovibrio gigas (strain ATCC 19364 / DSM 1382 / NCIMB 9332 / VKM B-1759) TaxID=1121448 RepID=T2GE89_MEGG1|nr:monovalent cation/H(+) antiporter subunit G [Megalodesulfovibrio gigas]AGW14573.1 putative Na+/H+ antiporter subunit [Megalodesulfovibrio gigas DSM 1382 = ATCC 19364]
MEQAIIIVCIALNVLGLVFYTGGTVGIIRFPDFYARLHAAGKLDSLGALMMLAGCAIFELQHVNLGTVLTALKIMLIIVFIFLASPTATHAIVDAGLASRHDFWSKRKGASTPADDTPQEEN